MKNQKGFPQNLILCRTRNMEKSTTTLQQGIHNGLFHTIDGGVIKSTVTGQFCSSVEFPLPRKNTSEGGGITENLGIKFACQLARVLHKLDKTTLLTFGLDEALLTLIKCIGSTTESFTW